MEAEEKRKMMNGTMEWVEGESKHVIASLGFMRTEMNGERRRSGHGKQEYLLLALQFIGIIPVFGLKRLHLELLIGAFFSSSLSILSTEMSIREMKTSTETHISPALTQRPCYLPLLEIFSTS
uniref:Uncharacterized protein n=1 Tax=Lotus japonicus TaxID=34305 RepID=I3T9F7_LOTJA|nr:unknown [Lotus japonicus]